MNEKKKIIMRHHVYDVLKEYRSKMYLHTRIYNRAECMTRCKRVRTLSQSITRCTYSLVGVHTRSDNDDQTACRFKPIACAEESFDPANTRIRRVVYIVPPQPHHHPFDALGQNNTPSTYNKFHESGFHSNMYQRRCT